MESSKKVTEITRGNVVSKDGTGIAFEQCGKGPLLLIISGALSFRKSKGVNELTEELARNFKVISYDRRGRGESGDTGVYKVEREIEDIESLLDHIHSKAVLFGVSSGAALALKAALKLGPGKISKLVMYEPPFGFAEIMGRNEYDMLKKEISRLINANQPGDAITAFFRSLNTPDEQIQAMKNSAEWKDMVTVAHTLVYDFEILGDGLVPLQEASSLAIPTLILDGERSFDFIHTTVEKLAQAIPGAKRKTLDGETHVVSPGRVTPIIKDFAG